MTYAKMMRFMGVLGAIWGVIGLSLLLVYAIFRLSPIALETFSYPLRWYHWVILLTVTILMAYFEGYRGFQKGFSPRAAARAKHLVHRPNLLHTLLGPFFCLSYFYTSKRRQRASISLTAGIIILVLLVRLLNQPWRGIIDAGVVVGLSWGIVSLLVFSVLAFTSAEFDYSPEVPTPKELPTQPHPAIEEHLDIA